MNCLRSKQEERGRKLRRLRWCLPLSLIVTLRVCLSATLRVREEQAPSLPRRTNVTPPPGREAPNPYHSD